MEYDSDKKVKVEDENLCLICYEEFTGKFSFLFLG